MKVKVISDADILIPNKEHQNFTETGKVIKAGTELNGEIKLIKGKRRGEDFIYKMFVTSEKQLIYFKKINPMEVTEVTLGADNQQSPTVVNVPVKRKLFSKNAVIYTIIGGGLGFAVCKYKKMPTKKTLMWTSIGAVVGFAIGTYVDKRKAVKVQPSK